MFRAQGGTLDFKWQGWSNGGKYKLNQKKSLDQNLTPQKFHAKFPSHKNVQRNYPAEIRRNYHEPPDCFEYPKKSLLKSSYQNNTCQNFRTQENPDSQNFKPKKILWSPLSLEIRSTSLGFWVQKIGGIGVLPKAQGGSQCLSDKAGNEGTNSWNSLFFLGKVGTLETLVTLFHLSQEKSNELETSCLVLLF